MSYLNLRNGIQLYYEEIGTGDPVILMHGWTSNHTIYLRPAKKLQHKARFILYDHRGHYQSKEANREPVSMDTLADDLHALIQHLSLSNVTLLGWSMGAGVAMNYIRRYGCDALRQVVLCDMTPKQINDESWHLGLYQGHYTMADHQASIGKDFLSLYRSFAVGAKPICAKMPTFILNHVLKKRLMLCDESVLRTLSASMKEQDLRDVIGTITVPLTYFYAVPGSLFSPELAAWYRKHCHAPFQAVAFHNSTHLFISEHPDQFADQLERLL